MRQAAAAVALQPGAACALRQAQAAGVELHVCSANWSARWIEEILAADSEAAAVALRSIRSNELELDRDGASTGLLRREVVSAHDKARVQRELAADSGARCGWARATVFVGDALPDLTALCAADVGIVVGEDARGLGRASRAMGVCFGGGSGHGPRPDAGRLLRTGWGTCRHCHLQLRACITPHEAAWCAEANLPRCKRHVGRAPRRHSA